MPISPDTYLKCLSDAFTPVRSASDGRLLGCVPRVADDAIMCGPFPLQLAAQVCVAVPDDMFGRVVAELPGFAPIDDSQVDLALPAAGTTDDDLAEGV
jgi:hypothetical protein